MSYTTTITNPDGTINHNAPPSAKKGIPLGKPGSLTRQYTPRFCRFGIPDVPDKCKPSYSKITYKNTITMMGVVHDLTIFDSAAWVDGMKNQAHLSQLFRAMTGKSLYTPKPEAVNPAGYQVPRVDRIRRYGGD